MNDAFRPFDQLRQHYEQVAPLLAGLSRLDGMLPHHQKLVRFVMNQWLDSICCNPISSWLRSSKSPK